MSNALAMKQSDSELIAVLQSSLYPGATIGSVQMVLNYCTAAGLDPMQKPVHIVPIWDGKAKQMRDVVMPGIGLYRTQAARSGQYAGVTEPEFGDDVTETLDGVTVTFPRWCRVTVRRLLTNGAVVDFTAKELWKENYATAKRDSDAPNAMWKRRPYAQLAKCFDPETEVLTTHGFQRFSEVTGRIIQATDRGVSPCDAHPFSQDYDGEMIVADGSRLNFVVTPNHDMLTTGGKIEAGALYEQATTVGDKFLIPCAPDVRVEEAPVSDSVLRLLGYFLADGSHTGYRQFRIAVSREHKIEALREIALHSNESIKADAGRVAQAVGREIITVADKVSFSYEWSLISGYVEQDKALSADRILALSSRQARVVVDALLAFDGSDNGGGVRRLSQLNEKVLAGFELAAVHAGYSVSAKARRHSDIGSAFTITVSDAAHFPVVRGVEKNRASLVKRRNVAGKVWCVTVPSGVIVVRRNGFSMLCGNCAEAQALRKAFPEFGAAATADEMEGKEINMGAADVVVQSTKPETQTTLPPYPADDFAKNLPTWRQAIESGKATADQIIARSSTKYTLSDEQKAAIKAPIQPAHVDEDGVIDADFVREFDGASND